MAWKRRIFEKVTSLSLMAMKQGWLDPDFLGQQIHQSEMKKSGIGQQCQRLTILIQSRWVSKSQHFWMFNFPPTWEIDSVHFPWQLWFDYLAARRLDSYGTSGSCMLQRSLSSTFCSSSNLWRINVQSGAMLTYTCEGQHFSVAPAIGPWNQLNNMGVSSKIWVKHIQTL